jgi:hypothetical protein
MHRFANPLRYQRIADAERILAVLDHLFIGF